MHTLLSTLNSIPPPLNYLSFNSHGIATPMAPIAVALFLLLVSHQPDSVSSDFLPPLFSPIFENVCKEVACGKGTCKVTENSFIPFECVCETGWKQPFSADGFQFLPCVFPNCTINYSCSHSDSPTPSPPPPPPKSATNGSEFDVCSWSFCGEGKCKRSSTNSSYSCSCSDGYDNLMNSSSLPCFRECALGGDCHNLGITLFNQTSRASPATNVDNTTNNARSLQYEKLPWFILVLVMFT